MEKFWILREEISFFFLSQPHSVENLSANLSANPNPCPFSINAGINLWKMGGFQDFAGNIEENLSLKFRGGKKISIGEGREFLEMPQGRIQAQLNIKTSFTTRLFQGFSTI